MRKLYHISFSSHEEVMFRSEEDINYGFNCFAFSCLETESRPLADCEMTTHVHFGLNADNPKALFRKFIYSYVRYFNSKYGRAGHLGENDAFVLAVDGLQHSQVMLIYVYRQALHHGLSDSPFGYNHCSANAIFKCSLGKLSPENVLSRSHMRKYLPRAFRDIPEGWRMSPSGLLLREDVIDTSYVEELFISPRNFLYLMNRPSSEAWKNEQCADNNGLPPITLDAIEPSCYQPSMAQLLQNETGRSFRNDITDLELCGIIDNHYLKLMKKQSIYELSDSERNALGNQLYADFKSGKISKLLGRNAGRLSVSQISRCVAIRYTR